MLGQTQFALFNDNVIISLCGAIVQTSGKITVEHSHGHNRKGNYCLLWIAVTRLTYFFM